MNATQKWLASLALAVLLAYLAPEWAAWLRVGGPYFVNGWDEETYLSWQGVLGSRGELGYVAMEVNYWLHVAGLSGAQQNLLFDSALPLTSVAMVAATLARFGFDRPRAFALAVLILFSSTLFNYANPVVKALLGPYDDSAFLMAGWELYPSILRTPNPQTSYFLIALAVYAWTRWRRFWLLLIPLPLLYYYVAVPYCCVLAMGVFAWWRKRADWRGLTGAGVALWLLMGLGTSTLFWLAGYSAPDHPFRQDDWLTTVTRLPQLPLGLIFLALAGAALAWRGQFDRASRWLPAVFVLALGALASVNLHVISGFMLSQKNYYDYGVSVLLGLLLVAGYASLRERGLADRLLGMTLAIVLLPTLASGVYFHLRAVAIGERAAPVAAQARADSLHALIADRDVSSRMAYSGARTLAPPFAYQYYFPFIEKQCSHYRALLDVAESTALARLPEESPARRELVETLAHIRAGQAGSRTKPYRALPYCLAEAYVPDGFTLLPTRP